MEPAPTEPAIRLEAAASTVAAPRQLESGPAVAGSIVPRRQAVLRAQVGGSVQRTYALPGQRVKAGEVLVRLESGELRQAARSAQVAVANAQTNLQLAVAQRDRLQQLFEAGTIARHDLEQAQQSAADARSALAQARANEAEATKRLQDAVVRAPFAGWISAREVSDGDVVQVGAALYTLVDLTTNELVGFLPAQQAAAVRAGMPVAIELVGSRRELAGAVDRINPSTEQATRQVAIYVSFGDEASTLRAGSFAEGRVIVEQRRALAVPDEAIERTSDGASVAVVKEGVVRHAAVALGISDSDSGFVEVRSGLESGDRVLLGAARQLTAGTHVELAPPTPTATGASR